MPPESHWEGQCPLSSTGRGNVPLSPTGRGSDSKGTISHLLPPSQSVPQIRWVWEPQCRELETAIGTFHFPVYWLSSVTSGHTVVSSPRGKHQTHRPFYHHPKADGANTVKDL